MWRILPGKVNFSRSRNATGLSEQWSLLSSLNARKSRYETRIFGFEARNEIICDVDGMDVEVVALLKSDKLTSNAV